MTVTTHDIETKLAVLIDNDQVSMQLLLKLNAKFEALKSENAALQARVQTLEAKE